MGKEHTRKKCRWARDMHPVAMGGCPWPLCTVMRAVVCLYLFVCSIGLGNKMEKGISKRANGSTPRRKVS